MSWFKCECDRIIDSGRVPKSGDVFNCRCGRKYMWRQPADDRPGMWSEFMFMDQHDTPVSALRYKLLAAPFICGRYQIQHCYRCAAEDCCDNTTPERLFEITDIKRGQRPDQVRGIMKGYSSLEPNKHVKVGDSNWSLADSWTHKNEK